MPTNQELQDEVALLKQLLTKTNIGSKKQVKIPMATRESRTEWEEGCERSAAQIDIGYLLVADERATQKTNNLAKYQVDNKTLYFRIWESVPINMQPHVSKSKVKIGRGWKLFEAVRKLLTPTTRSTQAAMENKFHNLTMASPTDLLAFVNKIERTSASLKQQGLELSDSQMLNRLLNGIHGEYAIPKQTFLLKKNEDQTFQAAVDDFTAFGIDNNLITDFGAEQPSGGKPGRPALFNLQTDNDRKTNDKDRQQRNKQRNKQTSNEVCNNYLWGRCKFGKKCFRTHPTGKEGCRKGTTCSSCGREGHWHTECKRPNQDYMNKDQQQLPNVQLPSINNLYSVLEDEPEAAAFPFIVEIDNDEPDNEPELNQLQAERKAIISDSGATHGFTNDQDKAKRLQKNFLKVRHVNGSLMPSHTATVRWPLTDDSGGVHHIETPNCFFQKDIKQEIVSESQAAKLGYNIFKTKSLCTYSKDGKIAAVCHETNGLYPFHNTDCEKCKQPEVQEELSVHKKLASLESSSSRKSFSHETNGTHETQMGIQEISAAVNLSAGNKPSKQGIENLITWHVRLGHLNFPTLCKMFGATYKPELHRLCVACHKAKMHVLPHNTTPRDRAPGPLKWIWIDGWGKVEIRTPGGCQWYLLIVDDFSRKVFIYLTKTKAEWAGVLKQFIITQENQLQMKISRIYCDVDRVFIQDDVQGFLSKRGIELLPSAPYEHWMTGLPERVHRTITESAQAVRIFAGMPKTAWGEAVKFAEAVYNSTWKKALQFPQTPNEVYHQKLLPELRNNLRTFGCLAMAHVNQENPKRAGKLAEHSQTCVYLGPNPDRPGTHRLLTWPTRKVIIRYSVAFDERVFPFRNDFRQSLSSAINDFTNHEYPVVEDEDFGPMESDQPIAARTSGRQRTLSHAAIENVASGNQLTDNTLSLYQERPATGQNQVLFASVFATRIKWGVPPPYPPSSSLFVPRTSHEVPNCKDKLFWYKGESKEMGTLLELKALRYIHPKDAIAGIPVNKSDFRYRLKTDADGEPLPNGEGHKARLVLLGHRVDRVAEQIEPEDTYASVATYASLRIIMAIACQNGWEIEHYDVTGAFVNVPPKRTIYMEQPPRLKLQGKENWIIQLDKCLYGDPESGNSWANHVVELMTNFGFTTCSTQPNVYVLQKDNKILIAAVWTDDFVTGSGDRQQFAAYMNKHCKFNNLGRISHALGMKVEYEPNAGKLKVSCPSQVKALLARNNMQNCNEAKSPAIPNHYLAADEDSQKIQDIRPLVGSCVHLSRTCRPDITQPTNALASIAASPRKSHETAKQRLLRYLKGTVDLGISMSRQPDDKPPILPFADSDYANDIETRRSTNGIIIYLYGFPVLWLSKKQVCICLSSSEAEYVCVCEGGKLTVWLINFVRELGVKPKLPVEICEDNQSTILMSRNPLNHGRTKHVDVRYHWIRNQVKLGALKLKYVKSENQLADILSKPVSVAVFRHLMQLGFMGTKV